jgi:hypothetical protein
MASKTASVNPLQERHTAAIAELKRISDAVDDTPRGTWLRRMAHARRVLAVIYREASDRHHHDSIEWHGLREVSLLLETHAAANLTAAHLDDLDRKSIQDGAA